MSALHISGGKEAKEGGQSNRVLGLAGRRGITRRRKQALIAQPILITSRNQN